MPSIVIEKGKQKGKSIPLESEKRIYFGRDDSCHIPFEDSLASRQHFCIEKDQDKFHLIDLGSRNGTFLNSDQVKEAITLQFGDHIIAGETIFSFLTEEEAKERGGLVGQTVGGYQIEERLGRGGMGTVYRATQVSLQRPVALKILSPKLTKNPENLERFISEARAAGSLAHPSVVEVYDVGNEGDTHYISMEYLAGGSMEELLLHTDKILPIGAISLIQDVARGLQYAESKGVVHRDIKPENLMIHGDGSVKICDLGIAVGPEGEQTEGKVIGTPHYMAPEQAMGKRVDHRSDIYSLGCTFYRMLAGKLPFTGASHDTILEKQVFFHPPSLHSFVDEVSIELSDLVEWMMAKDPDERIPNASVLLQELERCMEIEMSSGSHEAQSPVPVLRSALTTKISSTNRARRRKSVRRRRKASAWWLPLVVATVILPAMFLVSLKRNGATHPSSAAQTAAQTSATVAQPVAVSEENSRWLIEAKAYENVNPEDVSGAIKRFETVRNLFPDSHQEKEARRALRRLYHKRKQLEQLEKTWQTTVERTQLAVDQFKFGTALSYMNAYEKKNGRSPQARLVPKYTAQIEQLAADTFKTRVQQAEAFEGDGKIDEAAEIYKSIVNTWWIEPYVSEARTKLATIRPEVADSSDTGSK